MYTCSRSPSLARALYQKIGSPGRRIWHAGFEQRLPPELVHACSPCTGWTQSHSSLGACQVNEAATALAGIFEPVEPSSGSGVAGKMGNKTTVGALLGREKGREHIAPPPKSK